ncbi:MAG TPA: FGGY-family carbohydrate kinase [Candidatus Dormibacteraeota bacterium]|nr:FGGY-family carbohydrate kinase [Candidatus Dormibacteraeota bacterium]
MSLIGIDVGSTGTKISAYDQEGKPLGSIYAAHTPRHPFPGAWELDAEEIWNNATNGLRHLAATEPVKQVPPRAIAVSASTREGFPVDAEGKALGPCIMTADTRESGLEKTISNAFSADEWFAFCGHTPERMDPVCRILWWEKNQPNVMRRAKHFVGWGEFLSLRLTGKAVVDYSHAARFLVYDFRTHRWSPERISQFGINAALLPEIRPWGEIIGAVPREISRNLGFTNDVELAMGANDAVCTVLGAGVSQVGTGALISGSWENILLPVTEPPSPSVLVNAGVSIGPYPGKAKWMIYGLSPTGSATLNWARELVNVKLEDEDGMLHRLGDGPGHVLAAPHVSGATAVWVGGSGLRAALIGMTLATSPIDVVKAFMESIAYDTCFLVDMLKEGGAVIQMLRGVGGGVRSDWWTQLKADLTSTVIETVDQPELGTLGAALLAGKAVGMWDDLERKAGEFTGASKRYDPNPKRAALYKQRMEFYRTLMKEWLSKDWSPLTIQTTKPNL